MPVLPGMPVNARRSSPGRMRGLIQATADGSGGTAVSTSSRSKRVVEVPVVVQMLVVPDALAGVAVQGERRVVVQVIRSVPPSMNLGGGEVTDVPT